MEKEEILAKSRAENKNRDVYDVEVQRKGATWGNAVMITAACFFHELEYLVKGRRNYAFYALVCVSLAVTFWYKWIQRKKKHEFWTALIYTLCAIGFTAVYMIGLMRR